MKVEKIPIDLDKRRHLVYDLSAIYDLEQSYGSFNLAVRSVRIDAFDDTARMLYFGLRHEDSTLTEAFVDQHINVTNRIEIVGKIIDAISKSLPEKNKQQNDLSANQTPNNDGGNAPWEWDWLYYFGTVLLGMSEAVFWSCTPRKLFALMDVHRKYHGGDESQSPEYQKAQAWVDQYI
ncbi:hypothetical protein J41TS12_41570 [Paenibacillus antibioticophila]|uniref:Uncharacterized protein n=1 Tax=Paenibacillus antibioticophila TaxID=1274374 RepID=A0A920CGG4_9BACL|nr:hypothetical protein [Paenibacillus antibioticophila]GIO39296.1 hypothetical protein J41TS12_41570 [Paenibacillus antibioticophila]